MKETNFPFYYEIRFRVLKYEDNDNIENETFKREFKNANPLLAREEAFNEFKEYLSYIPSERIVKENSNIKIIKPISIKNLVNNERKDFEVFDKKYDRFQEEISIYLVIADDDLVNDFQDFQENSNEISDAEIQKNHELTIMLAETNEKLGLKGREGIEKDFLIHKVGSSLSTSEEQEMIDNLEFTELKLYKHCNIDTTDYETVVVHYGLDFCESVEDESQCESTILETPHVWSSKERYNIEFATNVDPQTEAGNSSIFNWKEIIELGEGEQIEFKPTLRYDFDLKKESNSVRYKIAKNICSFLNTKGGVLFIGVGNNQMIQGLEVGDYLLFNNNKRDMFRNEFDRLFYYFFSASVKPFVSLKIERIDNKDVGVVIVEKSKQPVFLKNRKHEGVEKEFVVRAEASSRFMTDVEEIIQYVFNNWKEK